MYRARVEAVSGLKVLADGKWLTCIGNKPARVGDIAWTDGRCVYGYEQTPQQPIVITSKEELGLGIPILLGKKCYTYTKPFKINYDTDLEIVNRFSYYVFSNNTKGQSVLAGFSYGFPGSPLGTISINIDDLGNVYQLIRTSAWNGSYFQISFTIKKNNVVVFCTEIPDQQFLAAFIENENNWYYVTYEIVDYSSYSSVDHNEVHFETKYILNTSQAKTDLINIHYDRFDEHVDYSLINSFDNVTFPMQDGFYFKIENFKYYVTNALDGEFEMDYVIYFESNNTPVFKYHSDTLNRGFSACKLKNKKFLCGIKSPFYAPNSSGKLYLIDNQEITELHPDLVRALYNACLRPMKKYKRWWEHIQTIE